MDVEMNTVLSTHLAQSLSRARSPLRRAGGLI